MSSQQSTVKEGEGALETAVSDGCDEGTRNSDPELPHSPRRPPFDLNNFPFTFENACGTAARSAHIEPDLNANTNYRDGESITSSVTAYREENGRTYHAYSDGSYHYPNDSLELERLDWQFICLKRLFNGKNYFAPWSQERPPKRILDLATGTGLWAVEMAEEFESSTVIGTDLSPIQPEYVPPNIRMSLGAWENFEIDVARKAFDHLEPDGWFEAQELLPSLGCDDGSMPADYAPNLLFNDLEDCARREQRPLDIAKTYKQGLINAGFVDVTQQVYKIPINGWARSRNWKTLGDLWNVNCLDAIQGVAMALLHRARGLKRHQIEIHLMETRRGLSDKSVHAYQSCYVVLGRKPRPDEVVATTSKPQ
ncbi:tam domain protein [Xylaria sp. FL0043]|nr:tam domain protein [Xylaria sp. FL0043]